MSEYRYFQAVLLYTKVDTEVFNWFNKYLDELDSMIGNALPIIIPEVVQKGEASEVYKAFEGDRYPGLKRSISHAFG